MSTEKDLPVPAGEEASLDVVPLEEIVQQVHAGHIRAAQLPRLVRQRCVAHLTYEGFTNAQIMELLGISARMVQRDRAAVRREQAVHPSPTLGDELLGEYQQITYATVQRLTRLCNDADTPPYARLWAEEAISRNYQRLIDTAHRLHYLDDGKARLAHQRAIDPATQQRQAEKVKAELRRTAAMLAGVIGGEA